MIYVEQKKGFGLGNFINLTPTIKKLSESHKIEVWFNDDFIRDCFIDCPFMTIIPQKKSIAPNLHSGMINLKNNMPDYLYVWQMFLGLLPCTDHTYIDNPLKQGPPDKYAVFINGSGSDNPGYILKKNPDVKAYQYLMKQLPESMLKIFVGSTSDYKRVMSLKFDGRFSGIRQALYLIAHASLVIANDSGLAHAAGAMNKKLLILWKDTLLPKNLNPGKNTIIIKKQNWMNYEIKHDLL